ncbi:hypothetical protein Pfo_018961 [Paulownia fortunei]|nr:hypothetical protein Pfo_018961 [Paulownia fortunei]
MMWCHRDRLEWPRWRYVFFPQCWDDKRRSSSRDVGCSNRAPISNDVPEAGSKRPHDFSLAFPPRPDGEKCLFSYTINQAEGAIPDGVIAKAIIREFVRGITLALILAKCGSYKESLTVLEAIEKRSMVEITQLKEEVKKVKEKPQLHKSGCVPKEVVMLIDLHIPKVEVDATVDPPTEEPTPATDGDERVDILGHDDGVADGTKDGAAPPAPPLV